MLQLVVSKRDKEFTMENKQNIMVVGDTHASWGPFNTLMAQEKPDMVIVCGDFGYWPKFEDFSLKRLKNGDIPIYFCDGNHDDHASLRSLKNNEVAPNVFYMKRGSVMELNEKTVLFMGGAYSIDRQYRILGRDYFNEETISYKDMMNIPEPNTKIDIVISHTCPNEFDGVHRLFTGPRFKDCSQDALSQMFTMYYPKQWYFGHWHQYAEGTYKGCDWKCLNMTPDIGCWCWLK